jgi:molecular chaperone GrpE
MSEDIKTAQSNPAGKDPSRRGEAGNDEPEQSEQPGPGEMSGGAEGNASAADAAEARLDQGGGGSEEALAAQLDALKAELAEHKDRYLRAAAEAENIRRRADNEVANARKFAIEGFASELLAVRDSLEIAQSLDISDDDAGAVAKMKEGLDLTLKQLDNAFAKYSIEAVDPQMGDKLDPERHQAMTTQESDNVPPNHILSVLQKGYTIHDRLLRPAMVVVAKKPEGETQVEGETA